MEGLSSFEQAVLDMLLAGNHPALAALRTQAERAKLEFRKFTGVGFYVHFSVPSDVPTAGTSTRNDFEVSGVSADIKGLSHGAGFILFVRKGRLAFLEGYSYDETWPESTDDFVLRYNQQHSKFDLQDAPIQSHGSGEHPGSA